MAIPIIIMGDSGAGKSSSLEYLPPDQTLMVQPLRKPLPFPFRRYGWDYRSNENPHGNIISTPEWKGIWKYSLHSQRPICVLDDFQYNMVDEFMGRTGEHGFNKFTEIGNNVYQLVKAVIAQPSDRRIYFLWHTQTDETGKIKAKTIGKLLDEKVTMEGMFTVVLMAVKNSTTKEHLFLTSSTGNDTVKSPRGMFHVDAIPNDLLMVDNAICDYYGIPKVNPNPQAA